MPSNMIQWEEHNIMLVVFLPKMHNLNLFERKHQTNSRWGTFYRVTGLFFKNGKITTNKKTQELFQVEWNWRAMMTECKAWPWMVSESEIQGEKEEVFWFCFVEGELVFYCSSIFDVNNITEISVKFEHCLWIR